MRHAVMMGVVGALLAGSNWVRAAENAPAPEGDAAKPAALRADAPDPGDLRAKCDAHDDARTFARLAGGDGLLSQEEFKAAGADCAAWSFGRFRWEDAIAFDANGDKQLSLDEACRYKREQRTKLEAVHKRLEAGLAEAITKEDKEAALTALERLAKVEKHLVPAWVDGGLAPQAAPGGLRPDRKDDDEAAAPARWDPAAHREAVDELRKSILTARKRTAELRERTKQAIEAGDMQRAGELATEMSVAASKLHPPLRRPVARRGGESGDEDEGDTAKPAKRKAAASQPAKRKKKLDEDDGDEEGEKVGAKGKTVRRAESKARRSRKERTSGRRRRSSRRTTRRHE